MSVQIRPFHLRVFSSLSLDIAAGFILLAIGSRDVVSLIVDVFFAIFLVYISLRLEEILETLR